MINIENLNKLYNEVINEGILTTAKLNSFGFNSKDINVLIESGQLERKKRGLYSFKSVSELYEYGKNLNKDKKSIEAVKCFERCYELDPNNQKVCLQLLYESLIKNDYESSFEYIDKLLTAEDQYSTANCKFYLYLLSMITDIPDNYKEFIENINIDDIKVETDDKKYKSIEKQNKIRFSALRRQFPYALKQMRDFIRQYDRWTIQNLITVNLLLEATRVESISKDTIKNLIKQKSYEDIVDYLEQKQKMHELSLMDKYTLKLAYEIINLQKSKQIPEIAFVDTTNTFLAIDNNDFNLALKLCEEYNFKNKIDSSESAINLLLIDICDIIKQLKSSKESIKKSEEKSPIEILNEQQLPVPSNQASSTFSDIIKFLLSKDIENAFSTLKNYMESINKAEYEFLIIDLIKLSLIEKDAAFTKPMIALTYISRDNFEFDISNYIQDFYVTLSNNRFSEARIYLDIISKSNKIAKNNIPTEELLQVLNNVEMTLDKNSSSHFEPTENDLKESTESTIPNKNTSPEILESNDKTQSVKQEENSNINQGVEKENNNQKQPLEKRDSEKEFIEKNYQLLLKRKSLILLKPMTAERRQRIYNIISEYPNVSAFSIGEESDKSIVLRYSESAKEYIDFKQIALNGEKNYKDGDYDSCINNYLKLLRFGTPSSYVYARLGLAYMKKKKISTAIDFLTISTDLNKKENGKYDYTDLITSLRGLEEDNDEKAYFKMKIEDFNNDTENNYGIENIDEITSKILESGQDVETVCENLGIKEEQTDTIKLIYARQFYSQGNYKKGDQFLKSVEQSQNKTKFTTKILNEIRQNKKFYFNRPNAGAKQLSLTMNPKKAKNN